MVNPFRLEYFIETTTTVKQWQPHIWGLGIGGQPVERKETSRYGDTVWNEDKLGSRLSKRLKFPPFQQVRFIFLNPQKVSEIYFWWRIFSKLESRKSFTRADSEKSGHTNR